MTHKEIQKLIDRYLAGETTAQEEKLLARELLCDNLPADWKIVREMLGELALGEAEYDRIMEERRKASAINQRNLSVKIQRRKVLRWSIAACLAALVCLGVVWEVATGTGSRSEEEKNPVRDDLFVAEVENSAASTTPSVTPHEAQRSVGIVPTAEETSVRPGVRLDERKAWKESYTKAHDNTAPTTPNPHTDMCGYRKNSGSATYASGTTSSPSAILPMLREDEAVQAVMLEYELFVLEEEFKNYDREMRLVEI